MVAQAPTPTIQQEGRGARSGGAPKPLLVKTQQSASTLDEQRLRDELRKMLREELVAMSRQPDPAAGPGPDELLDAIGEKSFLRQRGSTHEDQLVSMPGDVFSLMCVSPATSQAFAYGLAVFAAKLFFYSYSVGASSRQVTQLIMLPVTTVSDEGVFAALFLYRSIVWMPYIAEQNKMITEKRWRRSNLARFLDAVLYQVVVFFVLLQAEKILDIFLNFAALRFLMDLQRLAFDAAMNGYITNYLQSAAFGVRKVSLKVRECDFRNSASKLFAICSFLVMFTCFFIVQYVLT